MEFWVHACHVGVEGNSYWFRVKGAGDGSIVKIDDYALSTCYLECDLLVTGVSFNRFIYVVGRAEKKVGRHSWVKRPSKQIYRLDTGKLELGWKKVEVQLTKERKKPHIVELDGKLYVFESVGLPPKNEPLEVYDPVTETIKLLPQEKVHTSNYVLLGVDHDCKRIVFRSKQGAHLALYSPYNKDGNKWEIKEVRRDLFEVMFRAMRMIFTINRRTLYWVDGAHHLVAYNLDYNMISVPLHLGFISNYISVMSSIYDNDSILYHMDGDRFCFFWYSEGSKYRDDNKIYCTFLNISNAFVDGSFGLVVSESATHTYSIPGQGFEMLSVSPVAVR